MVSFRLAWQYQYSHHRHNSTTASCMCNVCLCVHRHIRKNARAGLALWMDCVCASVDGACDRAHWMVFPPSWRLTAARMLLFRALAGGRLPVRPLANVNSTEILLWIHDEWIVCSDAAASPDSLENETVTTWMSETIAGWKMCDCVCALLSDAYIFVTRRTCIHTQNAEKWRPHWLHITHNISIW